MSRLRRAWKFANRQLPAFDRAVRGAIEQRAHALHLAIGAVQSHRKIQAAGFLEDLAYVFGAARTFVAQFRGNQRKADQELFGAVDYLRLLLGADAREIGDVFARLRFGDAALRNAVEDSQGERRQRCEYQQQHEPVACA